MVYKSVLQIRKERAANKEFVLQISDVLQRSLPVEESREVYAFLFAFKSLCESVIVYYTQNVQLN